MLQRAFRSHLGLALLSIPSCSHATPVASASGVEVTQSSPNSENTLLTDTHLTLPHRSAIASAPPASAACEALAVAYCDRFKACAPHILHAELGDRAACVDGWAAWCTRAQTAPGSAFSDLEVEACEAGIRAVQCPHWRAFKDLTLDACHPKGAVEDEQACLVDAQCASGFCMLDPMRSDAACGKCEPRSESGGECYVQPETTERGCPIGSICSRGLCVGPLADEGEKCGPATPWSSDCYGDGMLFPQADTGCVGMWESADGFGTCERDHDVDPCGNDAACAPKRIGPGGACGYQDGENRECAFPLLCVAGSCAWADPECR